MQQNQSLAGYATSGLDFGCEIRNCPAMTLDRYMEQSKIQNKVLADFLKKDAATIGRYRSGEVTPPLTIIVEIERFTGGAVSFRDFLPARIASSESAA